MQCWYCEQESRGVCKACGRAVCHSHAHIHDTYTITKSDTSTGYTSYYQVHGALKCSDCRLEWTHHKPQ